jgi:hypothetical protein
MLVLYLASIERVSGASTECGVRAQGRTVMVLVCAPGLDEKAWREAGEEACGSLTQCNAWIWDDREKAPTEAPETDSDFTKEQVRNAVAVWIHDSRQMMLLRRVKE